MARTGRRQGFRVVLALVATALISASLGWPLQEQVSAYQRPGITERVSVASDGSQAEGSSGDPDLTPDGRYVAFVSAAHNLVPGDTNGRADVFLRDRKRKKTRLVSLGNDGSQGTGASHWPSVTATGRYVAFTSTAPNLVSGDTNLVMDVFVHDRKNHTTRRVSINSSGDQTTHQPLTLLSAGSYVPSISANGRYVAFQSDAVNLVENDTNGHQDVFVHDRKTKKTVRASVNSKGEQVNNSSWHPFISGNGRYVVFTSDASNLVPDDTNRTLFSDGRDVFVHDLKSGKTVRVSVASGGKESGGSLPCDGRFSCYSINDLSDVISADGRYVTFISRSQDLVPNDANRGRTNADVFVHDLKTRRTQRVSVTSSGQGLEQPSQGGRISTDGQYVSYERVYRFEYAYGYDLRTGVMEWLGTPASESCAVLEECVGIRAGNVNRNGRYVLLTSYADDLVPNDTNDAYDVFLRDRGPILGIGGFGGSAPRDDGDQDDNRICIEEVCLPPLGSVAFADELDDVDEAITERGANLIGGRVTNRAPLGDLYAVLELESMPRTPALAAATAGIVYGMSFTLDGKPYEIRATSTGLGPSGETTAAFGLFSCTDAELLCTKVTDLKGGFGTTGERITFSVPLDDLGIKKSSTISDVTAFTALGSFLGGSVRTLDKAKLEKK